MADEPLTPSQQLAVRDEVTRYLTRAAAAIGIGTLVAVAGGLSYIFSSFGDEAVSAARAQTDQYLATRAAGIDERIERALVKSERLETVADELTGKATYIDSDITSARAEVLSIRAAIRELREGEGVSTLTAFVEALSDSTNVNDILERLSAVEQAPVWPAGQYCILRNGGSCPDGFNPVEGGMSAIQMFKSDAGYLRPVQFGDSAISQHSNGGGNLSASWWHGQIDIRACCRMP